MAAGLLRAANGLAAAVPLVVLIVFLGGVDLGLVLLSGKWLRFDRAAAAAISVVAFGRGAADPWPGRLYRCRARARVVCSSPAFSDSQDAPLTGGPRWLTQAALWLLDSSPFGVGLSSSQGAMPRPGSIIESVLRMMGAFETAGAAVLTLWAAWRAAPGPSRPGGCRWAECATLRMLRQ